MPLVWREAPEICCLIIGSDLDDQSRRKLTHPSVELLGPVERLESAFERVRLTVAPRRFGAGLRDKVLRSMAAGVPYVRTAEAFSGMQALPEAITRDCQVSTASDLASAIVNMHRDEVTNAVCTQLGLSYTSSVYNQTRIDGLMCEMVQPALARYRAATRRRMKRSA